MTRPDPLPVPGLGVILGSSQALAIALASRSALDRPLRRTAELTVATLLDDAVVLGAFQRAAGLELPSSLALTRRGSGGPEVAVGPGTVWVSLALEDPSALIASANETRIVNRHVRPLLRALTKTLSRPGLTGAVAHFFGRDWISVSHRPVAWVGFGHDTASRRTVFEAFVAVRTPFALTERASFLGKPQATLETVVGGAVDEATLVEAIVAAYTRGADTEVLTLPATDLSVFLPPSPVDADPPWSAVVDEAIGTLGAGLDAKGTFRVGGDLLVSRDALARLEARSATAPADDLGRVVDQTLAAPGVALDGVRSLTSVRDVIASARRR